MRHIPLHKMSIAIELSVVGSDDLIEDFLDDCYDDETCLIPDSNEDNYEQYEGSCELTYHSRWSPTAQNWLKEIREKYSSLQFSVFWHDESDVPCFGFIEPNGTELKISNAEDLKLACKLLNKYKMKHPEPIPTAPIVPGWAPIPLDQLPRIPVRK